MRTLAVTAIGHDRPGIIAAITGVLAELGGNLEDSTMTLLRGHFAMMLIVSSPKSPDDVERALAPLAADLGLVLVIREVAAEAEPEPVGSAHVLTVHGADRPGIVSAVTHLVAEHGGNITDLATRVSGDLYLLVAEVDLPAATDVVELAGRLAGLAKELGVETSLRPADTDVL
jgi:glycine cleavage system transcriptional repressor